MQKIYSPFWIDFSQSFSRIFVIESKVRWNLFGKKRKKTKQEKRRRRKREIERIQRVTQLTRIECNGKLYNSKCATLIRYLLLMTMLMKTTSGTEKISKLDWTRAQCKVETIDGKLDSSSLNVHRIFIHFTRSLSHFLAPSRSIFPSFALPRFSFLSLSLYFSRSNAIKDILLVCRYVEMFQINIHCPSTFLVQSSSRDYYVSTGN